MIGTHMTMGEAFQHVADLHPRQEVFVCGSTRLTNRELLDRIGRLSSGLAGLGIAKGDRIVALLPPGPAFATLFFAAARMGAVIVPLNPELREQGLRDILADAEQAVVVTGEALAPRVLAVAIQSILIAGQMRNGPGLQVDPIHA